MSKPTPATVEISTLLFNSSQNAYLRNTYIILHCIQSDKVYTIRFRISSVDVVRKHPGTLSPCCCCECFKGVCATLWITSIVYSLKGRLLNTFPRPALRSRWSFPGCVPGVRCPLDDRHNKTGVVSPALLAYNSGLPSFPVHTRDTDPPRACAMACNSCTVNLSRFSLLFRFCGVCPVARARSASDSPARLANSRICSVVVSVIILTPLAREYIPRFICCQIIFIKSLKSIK